MAKIGSLHLAISGSVYFTADKMAFNIVISGVKEKLAGWFCAHLCQPFSFPFKFANRKSTTFTQNIRSDIMSIEVDSDERTYDRFTEYPHLPADGSDRLLRPVYGQVGGDASV